MRALCAALVLVAGDALADGIAPPSEGAGQLGRGGAWLARADDPLAAFFNPAAMARNPSGVTLGASVPVAKHCFSRLGPGGAPVSPGGDLAPATDPVCADLPPIPAVQFGASFHFGKRFAVGFAVVTADRPWTASWPDVVQYPNRFGVPNADNPAPQRYLALDDAAAFAYPTLSFAVAVLPNLSFGAGFVWGVARLSTSAMVATTGGASDDYRGDVKARLTATDAFVPGFVVSALWSPHRRLDLAAAYRFSDAVRAQADLYAQSGYYGPNGSLGAGIGDPATVTDARRAGRIELPLPMQAELGLRYYQPRSRVSDFDQQSWLARHGRWARDALSQDLFDVEVDLGWSHDSALDGIAVRFDDPVRLAGTAAFFPANADLARQWRDVVTVRFGGEWVAIPDFLALRAGGFVASKGVDDGYLALDVHRGLSGGAGGGLTVRLGRVDLLAAYQHTFYGALDNGGNGQIHGWSGDPASDRTAQAVNGGRATARRDAFALASTVHF